jgi:signal transduction histidine kinase
MANIAKRMTDLDFDARVDVRSDDEIGELGDSMNHLSAKLESTISELKSANAELHHDIENKIQIDEMRKEFLSHVSHELKTPIALIQGYAEGLKESVNDDPESRDFYCDVIMDEANKMNNMVKKLLSLNELEFGNNPVEVSRFDIVELIQNICASSDILLTNTEAELIFEEEGPCYVWADEFLMEQVMSNYITNAIHYVTPGGRIRIYFKHLDCELQVIVFNTEPPIPEEELDKLWIKFYKVDKARTREYGGSGIGLSIVAAAMEAHGKEYGVRNVEGGVEFYCNLDTNISC